MKYKFTYAIALLSLCSCNQMTGGSSSASNGPKIDTMRPKEQLTLIKKMADADSIANKQINDLNKRAVIDSGTKDVSNYLTSTLNAKVDNWVAYVSKLDEYGVIQLSFYKDWRKNTESLFEITLTAGVKDKDTSVMNMLKPLKVGDRVVISGEFVKLGGQVNNDIVAQGLEAESSIRSPLYDFNLTSIKKHN